MTYKLSADEVDRIRNLTTDEAELEFRELEAESDKLLRHDKLTGPQNDRVDELIERREQLANTIKRNELRDRVAGGSAHIENGTPFADDSRHLNGRPSRNETRGRALDLIERLDKSRSADHLGHDS